jgi:AraC family transcriptional activator of pobA
MLKFDFQKNKYGKELLIDCLPLEKISKLGTVLKKTHFTSFYEVFFITEGSGTMWLERDEYHFMAPSVLLLPQALPRRWDITPGCKGQVIIFESEFIESLFTDPYFLHRLHYFNHTDLSPVLPVSQEKLISYISLLQQFKAEIDHLVPDSQELLQSYLYQLLILLNRDYASYNQLTANLYKNNEMLNFKSLLKAHINEKQTVKEYAELMHINRNQLNQHCNKIFGKNAQDIIKQELLLATKRELLNSAKSIAEISYEYNFSAPSNFIRFFKSRTGESPVNYRKLYAN